MRAVLAGVAGVLWLAAAAPLGAHSVLVDASPGPASTVRAPAELALRFNNRVEWRLSRVRLGRLGGEPQELIVRPGPSPDRLAATLPRLESGPYQVEWQVLSADGHIVSGRYTFHVAP